MGQPLKVHQSPYLGERIVREWNKELKKSTPSLALALTRLLGQDLLCSAIVFFIFEFIVRMSQPIFLMKLVAYYSNNYSDDDNIHEAYLYAAGMILCSVLTVLLLHPNSLTVWSIGLKMRVAVMSLIYRKVLRLSRTALVDTTAGQMVNLLSNDVGRFEVSIMYVHYLWAGPLGAVFVIVILTYILDFWSAFIGIAVLMLFIPLQIFMGKMGAKLRLKVALRTDERVRFMNEIVEGIQVIKMYAWEKPFADVVDKARR